MSAFYKTGVFVANTATGNQAITGLGFTPKALRLFAVPVTSDAEAAPGNFAVGMTDFTNSRCIAVAVDDNVATSNSATDASTNLLKLLLTGTPTTDAIASIVSADADGFTINWSDAPSSAWQIHYEAWGGTDITNVEVGTWAPGSGTGNKAKTGMAFKPDVVILACSEVASGSSAVSANMGISAFSGASQEYAFVIGSTDARTATVVARYWHKAVSLLLQASGTAELDATCVSLDSAGWTLNFATHVATTYAIYYMAIKGGKWKVGSDTAPAGTGTKQTSGIGYQPIGVSFFGNLQPTQSAITSGQDIVSVGGSYGVNTSRAVAATYTNAINQRSAGGYAAKALHCDSGTATTLAEADMSAWDSDSFTLNWTTNAGSVAREFGYIAFGSSASTQTLTISVTQGQTVTLPKVVSKVVIP